MEYRKVFQTWTLLSPVDVVQPTAYEKSQKDAPSPDLVVSSSEFRMNVQHLRIKGRLSVSELARLVNCDAHTLAAYEEGQEILDDNIVSRIARILGEEQKESKQVSTKSLSK